MPMPKVKMTRFPGQKFVSPGGMTSRFNLKYPEDQEVYNSLVRARYVPVQGPDLPIEVYAARRAMLESDRPWFYAEEAYNKALEDERARQVYNRRVQAWDDYQNQFATTRRFYPNVRKIREDLSLRYPDMTREEIMEATRNPDTLDDWYNSQMYREGKGFGGHYFNYSAYPEVKSFEDFSDELVDAPWWEEFGQRRYY